MDTGCLFCAIVRGTVSAHEVYRDEHVVAFMDIGPIRPGHLQIVPVAHHKYFDDLPEELACRILLLGRKLAKIQKELFCVERIAFLFTGGDVPHAHAHLVPMTAGDDITSRRYIVEETVTYRAMPHPGDEELAAVAARLSRELVK